MNIFALKGHKVKCININTGYEYERELARQYLTIGNSYTLDYTNVGGSWTNVYLQEIPDVAFNSVFFTDVEPKSHENDKNHPDFNKYIRNITDNSETYFCRTILKIKDKIKILKLKARKAGI
ncbi:MAG: hypothetical protein AB9834_23015 [Lentimicrobium sp.]